MSLLVIIALAWSSNRSPGQASRPAATQPTIQHVERFLDHRVAEELSNSTPLSENQIEILHRLVDDYLRDSKQIGDSGQRALMDAGGRRIMEMETLLRQRMATMDERVALEEEIAPRMREVDRSNSSATR